MTRWREIALLCRSCPLSSAWILHAYIPLHYSVGYNESNWTWRWGLKKNGRWAVETAEGGPQVYKPETYSSVWPLIITPRFSFIIIPCPRVFREQCGLSVYCSLFTAQSVIHILRINYSIFQSFIVCSSVCLFRGPSICVSVLLRSLPLLSFFSWLGRSSLITWFTADHHSYDSQI